MNPDILFILGIVVVVITLILLKKVASLVKLIIAIAIFLVGGTSYVIFVPTSPFSAWITTNVAAFITIDTDNKFADGDTIFTYELSLKDDTEDEAEEEVTDFMQNVSENVSGFLADRIASIAAEYIELEESYTLVFSDSYLVITPGDYSASVEIIKGDS